MAKIKLTKNELKKQKDALKMYKRYLPTLQLKKQQLQTEIRGIEARAREVAEERDRHMAEFQSWVAVFGEEEAIKRPDGGWIISAGTIRTATGNIAGVDIPVFKGADFVIDEYDLFAKPLWIDRALDRLRAMLTLDLEIKVLEEQILRLGKELRTTTQRVNLFEKVKIPETALGIKKIGIYLGDQQTAQVVRGKMAKRKVERVAS
ncbi:MAG: V-type ATP synthase subunit D [Spirochaetae bacterium HGW-Spirochaetae-3]|nr:MAG: V-type ATP synthase subunit D [Spirochaetae bacterium HGW-Spirochaetae-3]